jgi:hypothetical protein
VASYGWLYPATDHYRASAVGDRVPGSTCNYGAEMEMWDIDFKSDRLLSRDYFHAIK